MPRPNSSNQQYFNPRSREGSDTAAAAAIMLLAADFNPRSREGSDRSVTRTVTGAENFNPRSREGSDAVT